MTEELSAVLESQFEALLETNGDDIYRELRRTLERLHRWPQTADLLKAEVDALREHFHEFDSRTSQSVATLRSIADRFVEADARVASDRDLSRPEDMTWMHPWLTSFAAFDRIAEGDPVKISPADELDVTAPPKLIKILKRKLEQAEDFPEARTDALRQFAAVKSAVTAEEEEHTRRWRAYVDEVRMSAASALIYLHRCVENISTPNPRPESQEEQRVMKLLDAPYPKERPALYRPLSGASSSDPGIDSQRAECFAAIRRLRKGLRLRLGTRRSIAAIFDRFKTRCEWHDRERLVELAERLGEASATSTRPKRTLAEQRLTEELARYLFDQGLSPMSEVPAGIARADLLQVDRLYVEAKQYDSSSAKSYVLRGTRQVFEMMTRLRAAQLPLREAFLVVFRRGGPWLSLPPKVEFIDEGWTLRPILIDLSPSSASGSRALKRIAISEAEVLASTAERWPVSSPKRATRRASVTDHGLGRRAGVTASLKSPRPSRSRSPAKRRR